MKYQFPENFGGFCSQRSSNRRRFEGDGKGQNIWDFGIKKRQKNFQQVGPDKTSQFYKNTKKIFS